MIYKIFGAFLLGVWALAPPRRIDQRERKKQQVSHENLFREKMEEIPGVAAGCVVGRSPLDDVRLALENRMVLRAARFEVGDQIGDLFDR